MRQSGHGAVVATGASVMATGASMMATGASMMITGATYTPSSTYKKHLTIQATSFLITGTVLLVILSLVYPLLVPLC